MKPIEKLRIILCTVPEIKEDLMELREWCEFMDEDNLKRTITNVISQDNETCRNFVYALDEEKKWVFMCEPKKIIWNPIQERHLRMYCEEMFENKDEYIFTIYWELQRIDTDMGEYLSTICKLDNTKDFQDQPDEVIESIVEFLEN